MVSDHHGQIERVNHYVDDSDSTAVESTRVNMRQLSASLGAVRIGGLARMTQKIGAFGRLNCSPALSPIGRVDEADIGLVESGRKARRDQGKSPGSRW